MEERLRGTAREERGDAEKDDEKKERRGTHRTEPPREEASGRDRWHAIERRRRASRTRNHGGGAIAAVRGMSRGLGRTTVRLLRNSERQAWGFLPARLVVARPTVPSFVRSLAARFARLAPGSVYVAGDRQSTVEAFLPSLFSSYYYYTTTSIRQQPRAAKLYRYNIL